MHKHNTKRNCYLIFFSNNLGKFFFNNGDRFEGEYKIGIKNGKG